MPHTFGAAKPVSFVHVVPPSRLRYAPASVAMYTRSLFDGSTCTDPTGDVPVNVVVHVAPPSVVLRTNPPSAPMKITPGRFGSASSDSGTPEAGSLITHVVPPSPLL